MSAGAKSPLTGTIKESNAGGTCGRMLGRLDIKAIIIEGQPAATDTWYQIRIGASGVVIEPETETVGMNNFAVLESVAGRYGEDKGVITIGSAGEPDDDLEHLDP